MIQENQGGSIYNKHIFDYLLFYGSKSPLFTKKTLQLADHRFEILRRLTLCPALSCGLPIYAD